MAVVLLTGGRAPAALALARLFHHAGHTVHAAESLPFPLTFFSRCVRGRHVLSPPVSHPRRFAAELRSVRADRLVAVNEELFWVSGLGLAPWCEVEGLDRLRRLHSKLLFPQWCAELGLPVPATRRVDGPDGDPRGLVFKPEFSRFASRIHVRPSTWPAGTWIAQEYLEGRHLCTWGYARKGRLLAHCAYAAEHRLGRGSALRFADEPCERVLAWVERFVEGAGFTGPIAFDLVDTERGLLPLECNPRFTSGIHLFRDRHDLADVLLGGSPAQTLRPVPGTVEQLSPLLGWRLPGRDALWDSRDPLPWFFSWVPLAVLALRGGSLTEASTRDIEWNGQPVSLMQP